MPAAVDLGYLRVTIQKERPDDSLGTFYHHEAKIGIAPNQTPYEEANTLLHEILHAIVYTYGLDLKPATEELVVTKMANGLCELLIRNPKVVRYLSEALTWPMPIKNT